MTDGPSAVTHAARQGFEETFGTDPSGVWFAPGRINLIGEHTDYNEGLVLPFALDRGVAAATSLSRDGWVDLVSEQTGLRRFAIDGLGRSRPGLGYAESALWAAGTRGIDVAGLDVYVTSTVPVGAGLSSSAAFIGALLVAVNDLTGSRIDVDELALTAQLAESDGVGVPVGVMDPMVSMLSQKGHAMLLDCQTLEYEHIPFEPAMPDADTEIVIVDTKTERSLAAGEYARRRRECQDAAAALGVASLRSVSTARLQDVSEALDEVSLRRGRHVVTENARVLEAAERIREGDISRLGRLLDDSHRSLAQDFEVSTPALDLAVAISREVGAYGARLAGGGFGGCVIGLFPSGSLSEAARAMKREFLARDLRPPAVFVGRSGPPAGRAL